MTKNGICDRRTSKQKAMRLFPQGGLFPSETVIASRLSQDPKHWPSLAVVLEREGLPRIDPLMGGRFWPAVEAYFCRRHGLHNHEIPVQADGLEKWQ